MAVVKDTESVEAKIQWYNDQVAQVKDNFVKWLNEMGYSVKTETTKVTNNEQKSGPYETYQYDLVINDDLIIRLIPYAIWILGAEGRIDVQGPSGVEKLVYFLKGGPLRETQNTQSIASQKAYFSIFDSVDTNDWYWLDDSSYRKVAKFSKDTVVPLLESIQ